MNKLLISLKRTSLAIAAILLIAVLISWGTTGHSAIGLIAEHHLTPQAASAVHDLLGSESLADISSWADDVRGEPEYKSTGPMHYINMPLGLDYPAFRNKVITVQEDNVYKAVRNCMRDLRSTGTSRRQKTEALKFLVHFVGDLHQPMHVSRAEDKGGNSIEVKYKGDASNLHSVWDSKLLEDQGLTYREIAEKFDTASPRQIAQWQHDSLTQWLWESYQISSVLYREIDEMKNSNLGKKYYIEHISAVDLRIEMAGLRLAGILNEVFDNSYIPPAKGEPIVAEVAKSIDVTDAASHIGEYATVCSKIYGHKDLDDITLVNLGRPYPDHLLTVVLKGEARAVYKKLDGRKICATGKIVNFKGKPEIIVSDPKKIVFP